MASCRALISRVWRAHTLLARGLGKSQQTAKGAEVGPIYLDCLAQNFRGGMK